MYFHSNKSGANALYVTRRKTRTEPFGASSPVDISPDAGRANVAFEGDGGGPLFFQQYDADGGHSHVHRADRAPDGGFLTPVELASLRASGQSFEPFVVGQDLWFTALNGQSSEFYHATLLEDGGAIDGGSVPELNTSYNEYTLKLSHDGETAYFASTRIDGSPKGLTDIWRARRDATSKKFTLAAPVAELNTKGNDFPNWLSADECRLYMTSDTSLGVAAIFISERIP